MGAVKNSFLFLPLLLTQLNLELTLTLPNYTVHIFFIQLDLEPVWTLSLHMLSLTYPLRYANLLTNKKSPYINYEHEF